MPRRGTTSEVGGIISANSKKNTVSDSRIEMDRDTWEDRLVNGMIYVEIDK